MGSFHVQSNFNRGEIHPSVYRRDDTEIYFAAAKELTNVRSVPQGGVELRSGTRYRTALAAKGRGWPFEFNVDQTYDVVASDVLLEVYLAGTQVAQLVAPWSLAEIFDEPHHVNASQYADTMILVHRSHQPRRLMRNVGGAGALTANPFTTVDLFAVVTVADPAHGLVTGMTAVFAGATGGNGILAADLNAVAGYVITRVDKDSYTITLPGAATGSGAIGGAAVTWSAADLWTLETITLTNIPQLAFNDALTPPTTNEVQQLTFTGGWSDGDKFRVKVGEPESEKLEYSSSPTQNADTIRAAIQALSSTALADSVEVTNTSGGGTDPKGPYRIEYSNEDGNKDMPEIVARVVASTGGGLIAVSTITEGGSGTEPVWSATRGWPGAVAFHEQRLLFGGSLFLPPRVWASGTDDPFDFAFGSANADEAFEMRSATGRLDGVVHVISGRHLQVMTTGSEMYCPESPLEPRNVVLKAQTSRGSAGARPVMFDGATVFVQRDGRAVRQFLYTDTEAAYSAEDLTMLARHMISSPTDMASEQGTLGDYLYVVNDDGTLAVLASNRSQGVASWSRYRTRSGDKFISVWAVHTSAQREVLRACVERSINGATVYYLEEFDPNLQMDCAIDLTSGAATAAWTGLSHLEGEEVVIKGDGLLLGTVDVAAGAVVAEAESTAVTVGLAWDWAVETLPVTFDNTNGRLSFRKKRIVRATVDLQDSAEVYVEGERLDPAHFGFDAAPLMNGQYETTLLGWDAQPTVRITGSGPWPFTLRGIELEVEVA